MYYLTELDDYYYYDVLELFQVEVLVYVEEVLVVCYVEALVQFAGG